MEFLDLDVFSVPHARHDAPAFRRRVNAEINLFAHNSAGAWERLCLLSCLALDLDLLKPRREQVMHGKATR